MKNTKNAKPNNISIVRQESKTLTEQGSVEIHEVDNILYDFTNVQIISDVNLGHLIGAVAYSEGQYIYYSEFA